MKSRASASIAHRTIRGAGWVILWRVATRILGMISTIVLARILVPADYGLVAIATAYTAIFDSLSEFGLHEAIIRTGEVDRGMLDTAFTMTAVRGVISGAVIACSAPWAAAFFDEPRLQLVLLVLALFPAMEGIENIGIVEFRRDLRFDKEFQIYLLPRLISIAVAITAAVLLKSYWALVIGLVMFRVVRLAFTYVMHSYRPRFSVVAWRRLFGFSFWTWATAVAEFVKNRSWAVILGRLFDTFSVGIFMLAWEIALSPLTEVIGPICRALFSGFSAARKQGLHLGDAFARTVAIVAVPILPAAIGISATAAYIVDLAVGPRWASATPILEWVAAASPLTILTAIGATALLVSAHLRTFFAIVSSTACLGTLSCWLMASRFGLVGAAESLAAFLIFEGLAFAIATAYSFETRFMNWAIPLWRPVLATCMMALVLWRTGYGWVDVAGNTRDVLVDGLSAALVGACTYVAILLLSWVLAGRPDGAEAYLLAFARRELGFDSLS